MAIMADILAVAFVMGAVIPLSVLGATQDPLKVVYPSVIVHANDRGNFTMLDLDAVTLSALIGSQTNNSAPWFRMSAVNGDIQLLPGINGTGKVYFEGEDLLYLFEMIASLPPIWSDHSPFGYLGEYHGGQRVFIQLKAEDPEGGHVTYSVVAGDVPPGMVLDPALGQVKGLAPDADTTYTFTVRATDYHGKYADNIFRIKVRGSNACEKTPCVHQAVCQDKRGDFHCNCIHPFGGKTCQLDCRRNALGVDQNLKIVPDAHMSGYKPYLRSFAYNGRLNGPGWNAMGNDSWLQIDLGDIMTGATCGAGDAHSFGTPDLAFGFCEGNTTQILAVEMQGCTANHYTTSYYLQLSTDGNAFHNYTTDGISAKNLPGYGNAASVYKSTLVQTVDARYVRFFPLGWKRSYTPCMRVELIGCYYI